MRLTPRGRLLLECCNVVLFIAFIWALLWIIA